MHIPYTWNRHVNVCVCVDMKRYRGKLSYLPVSADSMAQLTAAEAEDDAENDESTVKTPLLAPLDQPVPDDWVTIDEEFVLVGAIYQSHLAKDNQMASRAKLSDGVIHLVWTKSSLATRIGEIAVIKSNQIRRFAKAPQHQSSRPPSPHFASSEQ